VTVDERVVRAEGGERPPAGESELTTPSWLSHGGTLAGTSFLAMARRLPALLAEALGLAWGASRRDTLLAIGLTS